MILLMEGFDWPSVTSDLGQFWRNTDSTNITLDATGSRFGGKCLKIGQIGSSATNMPNIARRLRARPSGTMIRVAFWIKLSSGWTGNTALTGAEYLWSIRSVRSDLSGSYNLTAKLSTTGLLQVYKSSETHGNTRVIAVTGSTNINDNVWHRVEYEIDVGASGSVKTWIDTSIDINSAGIDTDDNSAVLGNYHFQTFSLSSGQYAPAAGEFIMIDDLVVWDDSGTFSGDMTSKDHRIVTLLPEADGSLSQWSRSTGADNYALVDDPFTSSHDSDGTYVAGTTAGLIDMYNYQPSAVFSDDIHAVAVKTVRSASSGLFGFYRARVKSGATIATGAPHHNVHGAYRTNEDVWDKDPATSLPWDFFDLNAAEFGIERIAS